MIKAIVCVDENWAIGNNNDLLFKLPLDMKFFRETTLWSTVICGRKTLESFPGGKPLKNRSTICLCSEENKRDDCYCVHSIDECKSLIKELSKTQNVFIIGGGSVYKALLDLCEMIYVTKVKADGNGTVYFPNLDEHPDFELYNNSGDTEDGEYVVNFCTYISKRIN